MAIEDNKLNIKVGMNTRGFQKGMKTVQGGFKRLNGAIGAFTAGFVGTQVFGVVKGLANMAGEAEKTELRFKRVFGSMSTSVSMFSSELSSDLGRVETDIKSGMVSFQAFFQGLGFGGKEAAGMSSKMQALSFDLASFFNIQDENAQKRFLAALAGSPEVLDQFGINLKQAALQTELYNMGIQSTVQNTDELTKTQGRLNIIMRAMTANGIVGDAQRTMNTWDNTVKRTWASLKEMGIAIGNLLIPVAKEFLEVVISLTKGVGKLFNINSKEIRVSEALAEEYKDITHQLLSSEKGTNSYKQAVEKLNSLYPSYYKNIDFAKISQEKLEEVVSTGTKQFEIQANILRKQKVYKERSQELKEMKSRLDDLNATMRKRQPFNAETGEGTKLRQQTGFGYMQEKGETLGQRQIELDLLQKQIDLLDAHIIAKEIIANDLQKETINAINDTTDAYKQHFGIEAEGIKNNSILSKDADEAQKQRQKDLFDEIKRRHDLLKFINSIQRENSEKLRELHAPLEATYNFYQDLVDAGLDFNTELDHTVDKLNALEEQIAKMDLFVEIKTGFKIPDLGGARDTVEENAENLVNVLRPFTDAAADLWMAILTPKDSTISHDEQKEKTEMMFAGVFQGLGQALFSVGMGIVLFNKGVASMETPAGVAMMVAGSGLIALGKSKAQKVKNSAHARDAGGGANNTTGNSGSMDSFLKAIQGEHTFRINGADLVSVLGRQNNFTNAIGG